MINVAWTVRLFIWIVLLPTLVACTQQQGQPSIGSPFPQCDLRNLKGEQTSIPGDFRGKVLIIRFWSDCCSYNIHEMEGLEAVLAKYRDRGLAIVTVYEGKAKGTAEQFVKDLKIPYPVLLDSGTLAARNCGVTTLPTTYIIDKTGVIREKITGESPKDVWTGKYDRLIGSLL